MVQQEQELYLNASASEFEEMKSQGHFKFFSKDIDAYA